MGDDDLKRLIGAASAEMRRHFDEAVERVEKKMDATAAEMQRHFDASAGEMRLHFDASTGEMRLHFDASTGEMRLHFDASTKQVMNQVRTVAEAVTQLDEKMDRANSDLRQEMRRDFTETQAMIKFSHAELDRRVRALEEAFADLQARVERLETTTH